MSEFICTNALMQEAENQTDMFQICLTCKDNLTCPILNGDYKDNKNAT